MAAVASAEHQMADPMWRLCSGALYKIMIKGDKGEDALVIPFKPNRAQRRLLRSFWHRNIILKARQLGFTTLICLMFLDMALFNPNMRCGIIAQDRDAAEVIFRDKVKFAYDNLPDALRERFPLGKRSASELLFAHNNSSIRVATSMRSGTIHALHVSEFGKICAKYPEKAREVMTGSLPAVPPNGIVFIESTAEGEEGEFADMSMTAEALAEAGKELGLQDYRFHFFPWWDEPGYVAEPRTVVISPEDHQYFDKIEGEIGRAILPEQRAWYVATRNTMFKSNPERMWQEYPSTSKEAFQQSTEGCYFVNQLTDARKQRRIGRVPHLPSYPVNTFWDIGANDETAIWFHQKVGGENRFIRYYEASGESFSHFVTMMQGTGWIWGKHYLPHDAAHVRQGQEKNKSAEEMLTELGLKNIVIVPRTPEKILAINQTRDAFGSCLIDEENCAIGIKHLSLYRKEWDERRSCWRNTPRHDEHSNGADAFLQFGQASAGIKGTTSSNAKAKRSAPSWRKG